MKNHLYIKRMSAFAQYLEGMKALPINEDFKTIILRDLCGEAMIEYQITIPMWIIEQLPKRFKEWSYDEEGEPVMIGANPEEDNAASIFDFFELTPEEFSHAFDIDGFQNIEMYGGTYLMEDSEPFEFAKNIKGIVLKWLLDNDARIKN